MRFEPGFEGLESVCFFWYMWRRLEIKGVGSGNIFGLGFGVF